MKNMPIFDYINTKSLRVIGFLIITSVFCYGQSVLKQDNKYGIQDEAGNIIVPVAPLDPKVSIFNGPGCTI